MKSKILIIEDEAPLQNIIKNKFVKEGFDVSVASDGEEGLKKAIELKPDMILLDIVMPKKDGLTVLQDLREDEWGKNAKVIILTNLNNEEEIVTAINKGARDYLVKADWDLSDVVKKVKERLS